MRHFTIALLAALALSSALANDTLMTLAAGGLVPLKSTEISMESEQLEISVHRVTILYRFHNRTDHDIDATVGFPLPTINGGDLYHEPSKLPAKDPVNFVGFEVTVDGVRVPVKVESRAFLDGRDVTARLQSVGIPASAVAVQNGNLLARLTRAQRGALTKEELIGCEDNDCYAAWESRIQYYWQQRFPAGKSIEVRHSYQPVVGGSYIVGSMNGKSNIEPFCGSAEGIAAIAQFKRRHPAKTQDDIVLRERHVGYILTTANNWNGPIGSFHLSVVLDSPEDMLFTCTAGLQRLSPTRYQLDRSNFRPDKELDLMILVAER